MKQRSIRLAATGARLAAGAIVAAACALAVVAGSVAPWPEVRTEPATSTVTPVPSDSVLVCSGSFRVLGRDATKADLMVSAAALELRVDGDHDATASAPLELPDLAGGSGAQAITGAVEGRKVPRFSAVESTRLSDDDATGFAAAPCREPSLSTWLVGGDVSTGASDIIVLSNPGAVTATVQLDSYGASRSASTVVVPAETQLGVPLASVAAGEDSPVVRVRSSGAPVRASLQSTMVRTLDPVGIDLQDGVSGPQDRQMILGVHSAPATVGDDTTGIVVRMLAPDADAHVTVRVRAVGSATALDEYAVDLVAATPGEIGLTGLSDGAYDIEIASSEPVVAAARQTTRAGDRQDFAWSLPAPELTASTATMFSVPSGAPATLYLRNPEDHEITVALSGKDEKTARLPAGGSAAVRVRSGGYVLEADGRVSAAVGILGTGDDATIAGWPLWPVAATQRPILVRP
ncbi:DUF5719 family protein [Microbacterium sp. ARD32]|uniref:DUF5719 family protein n=1 Tax=Microbacterium sp. ARD32 TaxID=2962577 RepID=UPI00288158BE|nr:DUF5719 family protein [Microbacterium sp. ARD32]MDT0156775.1 DUF5719 family protein [Microbacterium sp. ARD32]